MTAGVISALYDALTRKVADTFPDANVYETAPEQGVSGGDFLCGLTSAARTYTSVQHVRTDAVFEVMYVPKETVMRDVAVTDVLLAAMHELEVEGSLLRGDSLAAAYTEDGLLRATVHYARTVRPISVEADTMRTLRTERT